MNSPKKIKSVFCESLIDKHDNEPSAFCCPSCDNWTLATAGHFSVLRDKTLCNACFVHENNKLLKEIAAKDMTHAFENYKEILEAHGKSLYFDILNSIHNLIMRTL